MMPFRAVSRLLYIGVKFFFEGLSFLRLMASSKGSLAAEVLFLRKQLAFYQERKIKPRRFNDSTRVLLVLLGKLFDWKNALLNVKPETFIGWHKQAFRLFWRWKSQGRKTTPAERHSTTDLGDGGQQSHMGTRAYSRRVVAQAWNSCLAAHGEKLLATGFGAQTRARTGLDNFRPKSCQRHDRL